MTMAAPAHTPLYSYLPLWNSREGALVSYLYCAPGCVDTGNGRLLVPHHAAPSGEGAVHDAFVADTEALGNVTAELARMDAAGRRLLLICPVSYHSIKNSHRMMEYAGLCREIPEKQRRFLIIMITDIPDDPLHAEMRHAVEGLSALVYRVYGRTEGRTDVDFATLRECGLATLGYCLDPDMAGQKVQMQLMEAYSILARRKGIEDMFLLNAPNCTLAAAAACSFYTHISGPGVHTPVPCPESIYRFRHADLFRVSLLQAAASS